MAGARLELSAGARSLFCVRARCQGCFSVHKKHVCQHDSGANDMRMSHRVCPVRTRIALENHMSNVALNIYFTKCVKFIRQFRMCVMPGLYPLVCSGWKCI